MSTKLSLLIRDGLETDLTACLDLDHDYETEYVWQMNVHDDVGTLTASFKTERLPRIMEVKYPASESRLRACLPESQCFVVATERDSKAVIAYLTMFNLASRRIALLQDLVVARPYRGHRIGSRLLKVARNWAQERQLKQITIETQTKNHPGIQFCQQAGFTFCGYNDRYFENQDIAIFFSQALRQSQT
jgi:GNAT superfamily N-acetyltransferase